MIKIFMILTIGFAWLTIICLMRNASRISRLEEKMEENDYGVIKKSK